MSQQQIIVDVSPKGEVKVSVKGVAGKGCKALTEDLERALGETTSSAPTPEMHQAVGQANTARR